MANWRKLGKGAWKAAQGLWNTWDPPPELVESVVRNTDIVDTDVNTFIRAGKPAESAPGGVYVPMHPSGTSDPVEQLYWRSLDNPEAIPLRHRAGGPRLDVDGLHHQRRPTYDPWIRTSPRVGQFWNSTDPGGHLYNVPSFDLPETGYSFGMSRFLPGSDADSIISTQFLKDYVIKGREDDVGDWMRSMIRSDNPYDRHYFEFLQTNPNSKDYGPLLENLTLDDITLAHISPDNPMYPRSLSLARTDLGYIDPRYGDRAYIDGIHAHEVLGHSLNNEIGILGLPFQDVGLRAFASRNYGPYGHMLDEATAHGVDSVWNRGRLRSGSQEVFDMGRRSPVSQARDTVRFLSDPGKQKYYDTYHGVQGFGKQHKNIMRGLRGGAGLLAAGGLYAPYSKISGYRDIERGLEASDDSVAGRQLTEWEPWMSVYDKGFRNSKGFREEMGPISSGLLDALTFPGHLMDSYRGHWDMEREHQEWMNEGRPGSWRDRQESGLETNVEGLPVLAPIADPPERRF